jgi:rhodanese-related sulfurtransferase
VHPTAVPTVDVSSVPPDAVLLDVREDDEWAAGHISGAIHVPMMRVPQQLQHDPGPLTPDATIVVVCKVGSRSAQVTAWLRQQGYSATNLAGGMYSWEAAGRPIESSDDRPPRIL